MGELLALILQGGGLGAVLPAIIQLLKPSWLRGNSARWGVWLVCCAVGAIYLWVTKQAPSFAGNPAEMTSAVILFGSLITTVAKNWYEMFEPFFHKIPSAIAGGRTQR